jgi:cytochrome c-type biogenesis protein
VTDGPLLPLFAVVAGLISITSPCVLPMLPSYLGFISSVPAAELDDARHRSALTRNALAFVAGFMAIFVVLGVTASALGTVLLRNIDAITRVAGGVLIFFGLVSAGVVRVAWLTREARVDVTRHRLDHLRGVVVGMSFAFGWTPCIGPVLAAVLTVAGTTGSTASGALLLALYSAGLGLPFVLVARGYGRAHSTLDWARRHGRAIQRVGGVVMVIVGLGYVTGIWAALFQPLQRWFARSGWPPI